MFFSQELRPVHGLALEQRFVELASEVSDCDGTHAEGGDLGVLQPGEMASPSPHEQQMMVN